MADFPRSPSPSTWCVLTVRARRAARAAGPARHRRRTRGAGRCPAASCCADEDLDAAAARELAEETGLTARGRPPRAARHATARPAATRAAGWSPSPTWPCCPTCPPRSPAATPPAAAWHGAGRAPASSPSTTTGSWPTGWSGPAPSSSTPRWRRRSARPSSPSPSCARSTRRSGARPLDPRNFHRKVTGTPGFVEPAGHSTAGERGRPAQLFRRGAAALLHPPMLRPGAAPKSR